LFGVIHLSIIQNPDCCSPILLRPFLNLIHSAKNAFEFEVSRIFRPARGLSISTNLNLIFPVCSRPLLSTHVEDRRLLPTDSSSTEGTAMTVQYARLTVVRNPEDSFKNIYSGFVNGIRIPTDEVQHARLTSTIETNGTHDARNVINEEGWIEVKKKEKKVRFKMQDQFGKTQRSGRIDRSNLK
jgi:hypothetical protein